MYVFSVKTEHCLQRLKKGNLTYVRVHNLAYIRATYLENCENYVVKKMPHIQQGKMIELALKFMEEKKIEFFLRKTTKNKISHKYAWSDAMPQCPGGWFHALG